MGLRLCLGLAGEICYRFRDLPGVSVFTGSAAGVSVFGASTAGTAGSTGAAGAGSAAAGTGASGLASARKEINHRDPR